MLIEAGPPVFSLCHCNALCDWSIVKSGLAPAPAAIVLVNRAIAHAGGSAGGKSIREHHAPDDDVYNTSQGLCLIACSKQRSDGQPTVDEAHSLHSRCGDASIASSPPNTHANEKNTMDGKLLQAATSLLGANGMRANHVVNTI